MMSKYTYGPTKIRNGAKYFYSVNYSYRCQLQFYAIKVYDCKIKEVRAIENGAVAYLIIENKEVWWTEVSKWWIMSHEQTLYFQTE